MADHLVVGGFVLVFFQKFRSAGESDLGDVFLHLIRIHADAVVDKFQSFFFRVYDYVYLRFVIVRELVFAHDFQFFQFGDGITAVGNHLPKENVVVRIKPFFDNGKYVFTVDG